MRPSTTASIDVDFTGTVAQARGAINSSYSQTLSGVVYALPLLRRPDHPDERGLLPPAAHVQLPSGTLVNPAPPAACGGRVVTVAAAVEAILDALAAGRPDHAVARELADPRVHAQRAAATTATPWLNLLYEFGGLGARPGADGPDATGAFFLGGRSVIPQIEPIEAQYPFVVRSSRLLAATRAGRVGGGAASASRRSSSCSPTPRSPCAATAWRCRHPATDGGAPGRPGPFAIERRRRHASSALPATGRQRRASTPATRFVMRTSGGGGLGSATERDPEPCAPTCAQVGVHARMHGATSRLRRRDRRRRRGRVERACSSSGSTSAARSPTSSSPRAGRACTSARCSRRPTTPSRACSTASRHALADGRRRGRRGHARRARHDAGHQRRSSSAPGGPVAFVTTEGSATCCGSAARRGSRRTATTCCSRRRRRSSSPA